MTCLIRTRAASSEMARLFAAFPDAGLQSPESIWQGDQVPVVVEDQVRRLTTKQWGLEAGQFAPPVPSKRRGVLYPRDLSARRSRLVDVEALERCLIIIESFAYPYGAKGSVDRAWVALEHAPLAAWAGLCTSSGCAGLLVRSPDILEPLTPNVPRLVSLEDCDRWLAGAPLLSLDPFFDDDQLYVEHLEERWTSGRADDDLELPFAA